MWRGLVGLAFVLAFASVGCSSNSATPAPASTVLSATGLVVAANGPDVSSVTTFTLRTNDGQTINFVVGTLDVSNGGLPAPHLREHMAGSTPTTVYYRVENGQNVAIKYTDAS
jgi:hypothetical protein